MPYYTELMIVPLYNASEVKNVCKTYEETRDCLVDLNYSYNEIVKLLMDGIDGSYRYLCDESYEEYNKIYNCLKSEGIQDDGEVCSKEFYDGVEKLFFARYSNYSTVYCKLTKVYMNCVANTVDKYCGNKASNWFREYDRKLRDPVFKRINCQMDEIIYINLKMKLSEYFYLIGGLMVLLSIFGLTIYLSCRSNKKAYKKFVNSKDEDSINGDINEESEF